MPWDAHRTNHPTIEEEQSGKTRGLSDTLDPSADTDAETKLTEALTDICPLLDRLGRAFTDFSPHIHRYCQPAPDAVVPSEGQQSATPPSRSAGPPQGLRQGLFPFGPLLSRHMFVFFPSHPSLLTS
jgi:hypothetical protein